MPGGWSGFVTCQKFKSDIQLSAIPIIFLTGNVEQFVKFFELGAADYVVKPFNQKEFIVRTHAVALKNATFSHKSATN
jgi:DNA-binding response OmpR family regulator